MAMKQTIIETGAIRGRVGGNQNCTVFCGIPYAAPTSGASRFMPPQPAAAWEGVRDCTEFGPICIQGVMFAGMPFSDFFIKEFYPYNWPQGEDSLVLNVWTPAETTDEKLPVMVWIHGGGMSAGYGHEMEFDGEAICKRGCILVTINYRVDVLAWFAHPELTAQSPLGMSGNLGLLDQNYALQWVQRNIAAFGGDSGNVTIFGQSAGGGSVTNHLVMPMSRGLFHRAIIQSGSGGASNLGSRYGDTDGENGIDLDACERWGIKACETLGKTVAELQAMEAQECFAALKKAEEAIGPCPRHNYHAIHFPNAAVAFNNGRGMNVPVMVGSVAGDGGMFPAQDNESYLKRMLHQHFDAFAERYPMDGQGGAIADAMQKVGTSGDLAVGYARAACSQANTYLYYFDPVIPEKNIIEFVKDGEAYHSAEMWYIFGVLGRCWRRFDGRHYDLSQTMTDYWTNFARSGDPNGNGVPVWPAYTVDGGETQILNERYIHTEERMSADIETYFSFLHEAAQDC